MKFKLILESDMIIKLFNDGKLITFKNSQYAYTRDDSSLC